MTDKKRLEEAKLMAEMLRVETRLPHDFPFDLVDWLVEQAERAQEYDRELISLEDNKHYVSEMLAKNKRFREALEFYANKINYLTFIENGKSNIEHDQGEKARKALEGEE